MRISLIVALAENAVIGDDRGMPWHLPRDLRRFRDLTWGKPIILGRKTFALLGKPLPGRPHVVLSRDRTFAAPGCVVVGDVQSALVVAGRMLDEMNAPGVGVPCDEVMVCGGAQVYEAFAAVVTRAYVSVVRARPEGDARFPVEAFGRDWACVASEEVAADQANAHAHSFAVLERAGSFLPVGQVFNLPLVHAPDPLWDRGRNVLRRNDSITAFTHRG